MTEGYDAMFEAERLLAEAAQDWTKAREAALDGLRALLIEWGMTPRADSVVGLLEQAAEMDESLLAFRAEATVLDRSEEAPDAAERAKIFVDAARARLTNI